MSEQETLLSIRNLKTYFVTDEAVLKAVDDVSFEVKKGETLGVVGESGCGKSVSCMSVVRLVQGGNVKYEGGQILFEGRDTLQMTEKELRKIRGEGYFHHIPGTHDGAEPFIYNRGSDEGSPEEPPENQ